MQFENSEPCDHYAACCVTLSDHMVDVSLGSSVPIETGKLEYWNVRKRQVMAFY